MTNKLTAAHLKTITDQKKPLPFEEVTLPEHGVSIGVQGLSARTALEHLKDWQDGDPVKSNKALLRSCLVDPETRLPLFKNNEALDAFLDTLKPETGTSLILTAGKLNGGSAEKNSKATPGESSSLN